MIDAVIYGVIPKANIENCFSPPPLIAFNSSRNPKSPVISFIPGTVIVLPKQNITKAPSVYKTLFLRSLLVFLNICLNVLNT